MKPPKCIPRRVYVLVNRDGEAVLADNRKGTLLDLAADGERAFTYQLVNTSDVMALVKRKRKAARK